MSELTTADAGALEYIIGYARSGCDSVHVLLEQGVCRSQFETSLSSGSVSAIPGGVYGPYSLVTALSFAGTETGDVLEEMCRRYSIVLSRHIPVRFGEAA